jgi:arsenical-resistance protein 2
MSTEQQPWHAAFPAPVSKAAFVTREETLQLFSSKTPGKDFILVDVRRTDFEVVHTYTHTLSITRC